MRLENTGLSAVDRQVSGKLRPGLRAVAAQRLTRADGRTVGVVRPDTSIKTIRGEWGNVKAVRSNSVGQWTNPTDETRPCKNVLPNILCYFLNERVRWGRRFVHLFTFAYPSAAAMGSGRNSPPAGMWLQGGGCRTAGCNPFTAWRASRSETPVISAPSPPVPEGFGGVSPRSRREGRWTIRLARGDVPSGGSGRTARTGARYTR